MSKKVIKKRAESINYFSHLPEAVFVTAKNCTGIFILLIITMALFWAVPQVKDCIKTMIADLDSQFWFFHIAVFWFAIQVWYIGRSSLCVVDLQVRNEKLAIDIQTWLPRVMGFFVFVIAIASYFFSKTSGEHMILAVVIDLILAALFVLFVLLRKNMFSRFYREIAVRGIDMKHDLKDMARNFPYMFISAGLFLLLFILFVISRVYVPQFIGTPAIVMSSLVVWGTFVLFLVMIDRNNKLPLTFLLTAYVVLISFCNNNHSAKLLPAGTGSQLVDRREDLVPAFRNWMDKRSGENSTAKVPVIFITCEGGGLRSGYWTAMYLAKLEASTGAKLHKEVFGFSTVSGGSFGAAVYTSFISAIADYKEETNKKKPEIYVDTNVMLRRDFISPVIASFFYPDMLQRFIPVPVSYFDRSRALERSWENSYHDTLSDSANTFKESFYKLWDGDKKYIVPNLFLNSTRVEDGRRTIISNINTYDPDSTYYDLGAQIKYLDRFSTSTAVLMSARFPYITPCGRIYNKPDICNKDKSSNIWGHLADGGYFENTGCATVYDILLKLKKESDSATFNKADFKIVILTNQETSGKANKINSGINKSGKILNEILQPVFTLLNAWKARSPYSINLVDSYFEEANTEKVRTRALLKKNIFKNVEIFEVNMNLDSNKVPLGWSLSKEARNYIKEYIDNLYKTGTGSPDAVNTQKLMDYISKHDVNIKGEPGNR